MELIRHGDQPLTQIARSCGFAAQSHFTRVFRQVTGEPPKRWQQLHRTR
jgi:AraC family transcriptional regulator